MQLDPSRLTGYLQVATNQELGTLAQQARDPSILTAVNAEMNRRRGGVPSLQSAGPVPVGPELQSEGPVPAPPALQSAGPVPTDMRSDNSLSWVDVPREAREKDDSVSGAWVPPWDRMGGPALPPGTTRAPSAARGGPDAYMAGSPQDTFADDAMNTDADMSGESMHAGARAHDDDIDPSLLETGKMLAEDDPSSIADIIAQIRGGGMTDDQLRSNAIAKAGFAMAASRNPTFFGALGEGAGAGLESYEKSKQENLLNRVRAAGLQQDENKQAESIRSNKAGEADARSRIEIAQENLGIAQQNFDLEREKFDKGFGTEQELKRAEIKLRQAQVETEKAQAQYYGARAANPTTVKPDNIVLEDGTLGQIVNGKVVQITGEDGKPVKGTKLGSSGKSGTALQQNAKYLVAIGLADDEAGAYKILQTGKTMSPDVRRRTAMTIATNQANADPTLAGAEREAFIEAQTQAIEDDLMTAGLGSDVPAATAPAAGTAPAAPAAPAPVQVPTGPSGMPEPRTKEQYDALPSGSQYRHPDGTVKTKK